MGKWKNGGFDEPKITPSLTGVKLEYEGRQWAVDAFKEPTEKFTGQPYEVINPVDLGAVIPEGKKIHRIDALVKEYRHFIFEMDDEDLEAQKTRAENLMGKGIVNRIVFSGNKSYHCRISLANPCRNKEQYTETWELLNRTYFDGKSDPNVKNPSRLCRAPGGIREKEPNKDAVQVVTYPPQGYFTFDYTPPMPNSEPQNITRRSNAGNAEAARTWERGGAVDGTRNATLPNAVNTWANEGKTLDQVLEYVDLNAEAYNREALRDYAARLYTGSVATAKRKQEVATVTYTSETDTQKAIRRCVDYAIDNLPNLNYAGVEGNETSIAVLFAEMFGDVCKYVPSIGFMVYYPESGCFITDIADPVIQALIAFMIQKAWQQSYDDNDLTGFLKKCKSYRVISNIIELVKTNEHIFIRQTELNRDPFMLNCQGEAHNLRTGEIRPSSPADLFTMTTGTKPVRGKCEKFNQFLMETFMNDVTICAWFMRWVGYGLTGDMSCSWFVNAWGGGGNGKGVLNELLNFICGTYRTALPDSIVIESRYSNPGGPSPEYYSIMEARSGYCDEVPPANLNMSTIKKITGKTAIKFRGMRENSFTEFISKTKLTLFSNNILLPRSVDKATRRRVRFVKFLNKPLKENPELAEEIKTEADHILYWIIEEAKEYAQKPGKANFPECDVIEQASREFLDQADDVQQFLDAKCKFDPSFSAKKSDLYRGYKAWADDEGKDHPMGPGHFSEDLQKKGYSISRTEGIFYFRGLEIVPPPKKNF